jgi:hypothetical protein
MFVSKRAGQKIIAAFVKHPANVVGFIDIDIVLPRIISKACTSIGSFFFVNGFVIGLSLFTRKGWVKHTSVFPLLYYVRVPIFCQVPCRIAYPKCMVWFRYLMASKALNRCGGGHGASVWANFFNTSVVSNQNRLKWPKKPSHWAESKCSWCPDDL